MQLAYGTIASIKVYLQQYILKYYIYCTTRKLQEKSGTRRGHEHACALRGACEGGGASKEDQIPPLSQLETTRGRSEVEVEADLYECRGIVGIEESCVGCGHGC